MMDVTLNFGGCEKGRVSGVRSCCILPSLNSLEFHVCFIFFPFVLAVLIHFKGQSLTCDQELRLKLIRLRLFALIKDK